MKKYVQVGCGLRGITAYAVPIAKEYGDCAELAGVYDCNRKRAELVSEYTGKDVPVFDDFDEMLAGVRPDTVIVTSKDCTHDDYIIRALKAGCDVLSEKPLTTTFEKALAIQKAQEESGKKVTVTFNLRFHPFFVRLKEIVSSNVLGQILSVHYEWMLDTSHGADYFRRWHRERANSGSLLVHKSSHHFDIVNWLLEEDPLFVNAFGTRRFYGSVRSERSERCLTCPYQKTCEFYMDIDGSPNLKRLYHDCEDADGYFRDGCVFSDKIDIEDSVSVNVRYSGGAVMSYSLTAHSPYEGLSLVLNGTKGRLEARTVESHGRDYNIEAQRYIKIFDRTGAETDIFVPQKSSAGHGGADVDLRNRLFRVPDLADPLVQMADLRAGMMAIGVGMAANLSMQEKRQVSLKEFYGRFL